MHRPAWRAGGVSPSLIPPGAFRGENWTKREGREHTGRELGTQGGSGIPSRAEPPALLGTTSFDPASLSPSQLPGRAVRDQNYLSML